MSAAVTASRPYQVPPFELVKLVHPPIFNAIAGPSSTPIHSSPGPASPPSAAQALTSLSRGGTGSPPPSSLSGRLSQLVNAKIPPDQRRFSDSNPLPPQWQSPASAVAAPGAPSTSKQVLRCADAGNDTVYVGGNEGSLAVWKLDATRASSKGKQKATYHDSDEHDSHSAEEAAYLLDQYHIVPGRRPVEKLAVLATVGKAIVLSEGVLTFHQLPTFTALPALAPIRGVSTFAVDQSNPHASFVTICVIKRKSMQLYLVSQFAIEQGKELPLRSTAIAGVMRHSSLCIADSVNYSMVDIVAATMTPLLPISQDSPETQPSQDADTPLSETARPKSHQRPCIIAVAEDEFLIANHTGHSALGLFIKENGDPVRGTLEWASNPKSIVADGNLIVALLQDNTLDIHSLDTQDLLQSIQLSTALMQPLLSPISSPPGTPSKSAVDLVHHDLKGELFSPRGIINCSAGCPGRGFVANSSNSFSPLIVPHLSASEALQKVSMRLFPEVNAVLQAEPAMPTEPQPPITPTKPVRKVSGLTATRPAASRRTPQAASSISAGVLILGKDSVLALCPTSMLAQADNLLANNQVEQALRLVASVNEPLSWERIEEIRYLLQKAAWIYLFQTRFKEAGQLFSQGQVDPRLLIRLFPDVCGDMIQTLLVEEVTIFSGLEGMLGEAVWRNSDIENIINLNLVRNYAPHLPPVSPTITDLHRKLVKSARDTLREFLASWRFERRSEGLKSLGFKSDDNDLAKDLDRLVDTCLAKLYLESDNGLPPLLDMLETEAHDIDVDEVAVMFESHELHYHLSQLYLAQGRLANVLQIWSELVDGMRQDGRFSDGPTKIFNLLEQCSDTELVSKFALWLVPKRRDLALKLLMNPAVGVHLDVDECLKHLRQIDDGATEQFLEHAVFTQRNMTTHHHDELLCRYLDKLEQYYKTTSFAQQLQSFQKTYAETANTVLSVLAFVLETPGDAAKLRAKIILLLHISNLYDKSIAQGRLEALDGVEFERAIIYAKLGMQEDTLKLLATTLRDMVAAEAYCAHAGSGEILGPKNVRDLLSAAHIALPTALLRKDGRRKAAAGPQPLTPAATVAEREAQRRSLLALIIKITLAQSLTAPVDMRASEQQRASHIIETQAVRISARDILPNIPGEWPLHLMESFMTRSLRRTLHSRYEQKLVKALLQGQTLDVSLRYYEIIAELGGTLAEEVSDDDDDENEKRAVDEFVHLEKEMVDPLQEKVMDIV